MMCPICSSQAEEVVQSTFDGLMVDCPNCGPFAVARVALPQLNQRTASSRADVLRNAQHLDLFAARPMITRASFGVPSHPLHFR